MLNSDAIAHKRFCQKTNRLLRPITPQKRASIEGFVSSLADKVDLALDKAFVIIDRQAPTGGMSLRLPLNAPNRAYPIGKQRDVKSASNRLRFSRIL